MPKIKDMVSIDVMVTRDILSKLGLSAKQISRDLCKGESYIQSVFDRGTIRARDIDLMKKILGVDLTPAIITEEEPHQKAETTPADDSVKQLEIITQLCTDHVIDAIVEHKENGTNDADRIVNTLLRIEGLLGKVLEKLS